eukprot:4123158-Amphidinium_carterae.1
MGDLEVSMDAEVITHKGPLLELITCHEAIIVAEVITPELPQLEVSTVPEGLIGREGIEVVANIIYASAGPGFALSFPLPLPGFFLCGASGPGKPSLPGPPAPAFFNESSSTF